MRRSDFARLALALTGVLCAPSFAYADDATPTPELRHLGEDAEVVLDSGKKLRGSLAVPQRSRAPVVLIVPGSGPVDRNGNTTAAGVSTDVYAYLAAALASRGIASLRYDKRGVGGSSSAVTSEVDVRFDDYIGDAAAWLVKLRSDARFSSISIAGHGEGSLIGMVAAATNQVDAFVSLEGAGRPLADILRAGLAPDLAGTPSLQTATERILNALSRGETTNDVPQELTPIFRPSVQPFLISAFKYDPRTAILKAGKRAAIVQGTADLQASVDDAKMLAAARPDAKLTIVDKMTHVLKIATNVAPQAQYATVYTNASIPLAPEVPEAVAACVLG